MKKMKVRLCSNGEALLWRGKWLITTPSGVGLAGADTLAEAIVDATRMWSRFEGL